MDDISEAQISPSPAVGLCASQITVRVLICLLCCFLNSASSSSCAYRWCSSRSVISFIRVEHSDAVAASSSFYKKLSCRWQTARRICTNAITWLDLNSVIKIRLKKNWFLASGLSRSLKVIGTDMDRSAIYDLLFVFHSNCVSKTHRFWDIRLQKFWDLENRVRVCQDHWKCHQSACDIDVL